jgi:predicted nuclease of predicted toxin-antitoxin system
MPQLRCDAPGWTSEHVGEVGFSQAEDIEIVRLARERNAVVVTLDADFHAILAVSEASGPSTIRLRLQGADGAQVAHLVADLIGRFADPLRRGCLLTVKPKKITCHMLPIISAR